MTPRAAAVIPARHASSRFPGKPLADLTGKPMIVHVLERAAACRTVGRIVVATDDERILRFVNANDAARLAELGTSCPDHFLRTKIKPLYVDWNPHFETSP